MCAKGRLRPDEGPEQGYFCGGGLSVVGLAITTGDDGRRCEQPECYLRRRAGCHCQQHAIVFITQYYRTLNTLVKSIAEASLTGSATNFLGWPVGLNSTVATALVSRVGGTAAFALGEHRVPGERRRSWSPTAVFFGQLRRRWPYTAVRPGDGHLRADHGQRQRHWRRDVRTGGKVREVTDLMTLSATLTKALTMGYAMAHWTVLPALWRIPDVVSISSRASST